MHSNSSAHLTSKQAGFPVNPVRVDGLVGVFNRSAQALDRLGTTAGTDIPHSYLIHGHFAATAGSTGNRLPNRRSEQSQGCRWLLQQLLQALHPMQCDAWSIRYSDRGAPQLLNNQTPSQYQLSFSHSQNHCTVALSAVARVAVDVECYDSGRDFVALGNYMNQHMGWQLADCSEAGFLTRWTLWEASAKISSASVLSEQIIAFEQLQHKAELNQMIRVGAWHVVQLARQNRAFFTLLLDYPQPCVLDFQPLDLSEIQPCQLPSPARYPAVATR